MAGERVHARLPPEPGPHTEGVPGGRASSSGRLADLHPVKAYRPAPATREGASDSPAPGSAGGTGRLEDAAAQAVATETARPIRLRATNSRSCSLRLGRDGLTPSRPAFFGPERRSHAKPRRREGKARAACAVTDPQVGSCHGRWSLLIAFSPLGEKVPKADEGTRERSVVAAALRVLQATVQLNALTVNEAMIRRERSYTSLYCHPEAMGGRVRGERRISALPIALRRDSREGLTRDGLAAATAERCNLRSPTRQRWESAGRRRAAERRHPG